MHRKPSRCSVCLLCHSRPVVFAVRHLRPSSGTPSGAPPTTPQASKHDGLLPHERAARERLLAAMRPKAAHPPVAPPGAYPASRRGPAAAARQPVDRTAFDRASRDPPWGERRDAYATQGSRPWQASTREGDSLKFPSLRSTREAPPTGDWESHDPFRSRQERQRATPDGSGRPRALFVPQYLRDTKSPLRSGSQEPSTSEPRPDAGEWPGLARRPRSNHPLLDSRNHGTSQSEFWARAREQYPSAHDQDRAQDDTRNSRFSTGRFGTETGAPMKPMTKTACNATDEVSKTVSREQRMPLTPTENLRTVRHDEEGRVEESGQRLANEEARSRQLPESKPNPIEEQVKEQTFPDTGLDDDDIRRRQSHRGRPDKPWKESNRRQSRHEEEGWDDDVAESRRQRKEQRKAERARQREQDLAMQQSGPMPILLPEFISVSNLAASLGIKQGLFLRQLGELGFEDITPDSVMTGETAALVAQEYGFEPTVDAGEGEDLKARPPPLDPSSLPHRPPVVTIMGHVDHGKTTLLDYLRKSSIAAQEHGGITQHIGAFSTKLSLGKQITFLDTPGHAAFLTMRQRGANVTDIVILVVAVDDSVKPQTIEALRHARSAKVPIIVAITKIDKDATRIDQVKADLARNGIDIEEYGGEVQAVCVSGKTGQGMGDLEESIVLLSEVLDIRAETDGMAEGWVLESSIKPVGRAATVLIKRGTLRQGDHIVAGCVQTKVRILRNEAGIEVTEAPPGTAVEILGWKDLPDAGDQVLQAPNEAKAKAAIRYRQEVKEHEIAMGEVSRIEQEKRERARELEATQRLEEEGGSGAAAEEETKVPGTQLVNFTVKCDVHGSVEAVCAAIMEIGSNEVRPRVLWSGPGQITESDVENAGTAGAIIVNFNNPILAAINSLAARSKVKILDHSVIYHLVDDVKAILSEYLAPVFTIRVLAEAEVQQVFKYNVKGRVYKNIAGLRVRSGQVTRNGKYRVMRGGEKVFDGSLESLKHGKSEVNEMRKGGECGMAFVEWDDVQVGDLVQLYEEVKETRRLQ